MIEQFIEDVSRLHRNQKCILEEARMLWRIQKSGSYQQQAYARQVASLEGEIEGIENTVTLLLGREKMEEVLGIEYDGGLVPV